MFESHLRHTFRGISSCAPLCKSASSIVHIFFFSNMATYSEREKELLVTIKHVIDEYDNVNTAEMTTLVYNYLVQPDVGRTQNGLHNKYERMKIEEPQKILNILSGNIETLKNAVRQTIQHLLKCKNALQQYTLDAYK